MNKKNKLRIILISFFSVVFSTLLTLSFVFSLKTPSKIEISNEEEFMNINNDLNGYYSLKNNIVLTKPFQIGDINNPFTGTIDGNFIYSVTIENYVLDEKNTIDNSLFVSLIPYNKGTIIHCNFYCYNQKFDFSSIDDSKTLYFGGVVGLNEGKITTCKYQPKYIVGKPLEYIVEFSNHKNVFYGYFTGLNKGDIRKDVSLGNVHIKGNIQNFYMGGFSGKMAQKKSIIEYCEKRAWIIKDIDCESNVVCGGFVAVLEGGSIVNSFCGKTNVGFNYKTSNQASEKTIFGGLVGIVRAEANVLFNSCVYLGSASFTGSSHPGSMSAAALVIGKIDGESSKISVKNSIFNGFCRCVDNGGYTSDFCALLDNDECLKNIDNTFVLDNFVEYVSNNSKYYFKKINSSNLSLEKMKWDSSIWEINNNEIIFKTN